MKLFLLRHGIAEDESASGLDEDRRLTDTGVRKTRRVVETLAQRVDRPELILTSPLVRAEQTAELAASAWGSPLETWALLGSNDAAAIMAALPARAEESLMLVGHEPSLSGLIERLCRAGEGRVQMKKAGCAALDVTLDETGVVASRLLWLVTPKLLGIE